MPNNNDRVNELLAKHDANIIIKKERIELHTALKIKYSYDALMPEYRCPKCNRPLIFSWDKGPICFWKNGGCGWSP